MKAPGEGKKRDAWERTNWNVFFRLGRGEMSFKSDPSIYDRMKVNLDPVKETNKEKVL